MKHAIDAFVGKGKSGDLYYDCTCGVRVRFPGDGEVVENEPINVGPERGWCPACFPDKVAAQLRDDDGNSIALHPELGELQQEGDGTTLAEDLGEETVLKEEVVED